MKPIDVNSNTYNDFKVESNVKKDSRFKIRNRARISKYKNFF